MLYDKVYMCTLLKIAAGYKKFTGNYVALVWLQDFDETHFL